VIWAHCQARSLRRAHLQLAARGSVGFVMLCRLSTKERAGFENSIKLAAEGLTYLLQMIAGSHKIHDTRHVDCRIAQQV
jgi:hypothetical protein